MDLVDLSDACFFYREICSRQLASFLRVTETLRMPPSSYSIWLVSFRCGVSLSSSRPGRSALRCVVSLGCGLLLCGADPLVPKRLRAARGTLAIFRICQCRGTPARRNQELSMISLDRSYVDFASAWWLDRDVAHDTCGPDPRAGGSGPWCRRDSSSEVPLESQTQETLCLQ